MRAYPKRVLKLFLLLGGSLFIIANVIFFFRVSENENLIPAQMTEAPTLKSYIVHTNNTNWSIHQTTLLEVEKNSRYEDAFSHLFENSSSILLRAAFSETNQYETIRNLDKYDLRPGDETIVIIVQVHDRADYLRYLIDSLQQADGIGQVLLIFSHDYFSRKIHDTVALVNFCPVMQIYYPYSMQLYPHSFPGEHPNDCPRNAKRDEASKMKCNNALWPDLYGHFREAKYSQIKHHWFWKANYVFERLSITKYFSGPVLFLEEDHYVSKDFLYVLNKMYRFRASACLDCSVFTLGNYDKKPSFDHTSKVGNSLGFLMNFFKLLFSNKIQKKNNIAFVDITNWVSSKHNMGMVFNREVWNKIRECAKQFCIYDDYNWDWSLQHIGMNCIKNKLKVMILKSPRVFHIGECGQHHKGKNCNPEQRISNIKAILHSNYKALFPETLTIYSYPKAPTRMPKPNGGWGDKRDHELCLSFVKHNEEDVIKTV